MERALKMFSTFVILYGVFYNGVNGRASREIDVMLKTLNKPASKTIMSEDGDIIDCVDIYKQPAFDHPALKNHTIQMKPSLELVSNQTYNSPINSSYIPITSQIWTKSGTCPEGTIPIRRVSREVISKASSPSQFGRKPHHVYNYLDKAHQHKANINSPAEIISRPPNPSEAFLLALGYNYIGAQSDINVWNPPGVQQDEYSTGQIWLIAGQTSIFESIEAGWMVNPSLFGDTRTRLFTSWTIDGYRKTGCINLLCSGFVQTSTHIALGAAINPISSFSNKQYYIRIGMFQDHGGNWWLFFGDIALGYWPSTLLENLRHSATAVQWGGAVYSPNVRKKPHTKASMGSGAWASRRFGKACFHTNIRIKDYSLHLKYPTLLSEYSDEYNCYSTLTHRNSDKAEPHFYFGGPGQNPRCP